MKQKDFDRLMDEAFEDECEIHFETGEGLDSAASLMIRGNGALLISATSYILQKVLDQIANTPEAKKECLKMIYDVVNSRL